MASDDGVLDIATIKGFTLRGWLERKVKGCHRQAQALRADAGSQAEPEARVWEMKAEAIREVIADIERIDWPPGHIARLAHHPDRGSSDAHESNKR